MNQPLTSEQVRRASLSGMFTATRGQQKAHADGMNEVRAIRLTTTPNDLQARYWEIAVEAEEALLTRKLGACQQARYAGRLLAALGHLG